MHTLTDAIRARAEMIESIGQPALMERLMLRCGVYSQGSALPAHVRRGTLKQCFRNATRLAWGGVGTYVEGFVLIPRIPLPIHHAWVIGLHGRVIDNTIQNPREHEYLGVRFTERQLNVTLMRTQTYGLLDPVREALPLIEEIAPGLLAECERMSAIGLTE